MPTPNPKFKIENKWNGKWKENKVYYLWFWYYFYFKISSLEELTSIFANFSPASLNILPQTFYYPIHITSLLYTSLVILLF